MLRRRARTSRAGTMRAAAQARHATNGRVTRLQVFVRSATLKDAAAMATVHRRAALVGYEGIFPRDAPVPTLDELVGRWEAAIAEGRTGAAVMVACHAGADRTVVGTVAAVPDLDDSSRAFLHGLYVDPGYWGRGVGRQLHDAALEHVRHRGQRVVALWVLEGNLRARAMYERWGWQPTTGRRTAYPGVEEIFYLREL